MNLFVVEFSKYNIRQGIGESSCLLVSVNYYSFFSYKYVIQQFKMIRTKYNYLLFTGQEVYIAKNLAKVLLRAILKTKSPHFF